MSSDASFLAFLLGLAYLASLGLRSFLARSYARRISQAPAPALAPHTLTVAQPILSGDAHLESRLRAQLAALPQQTFLWLFDEDDDEALEIASRVKREFPDTRVLLMVCWPCPDGVNPKLWKLSRLENTISTPFFGVVDDDTILPAASAAALVTAAREHTVATGLPYYEISRNSRWSALLAQFVNNNSAFTYLGTSRLLPPVTLNGMGYVMRQEEWAALDSFKPLLRELTDDLAVATAVLRRGGTIHQSSAPLQVLSEVRGPAHYFQYMHRWYVFTLLLLRRQRLPVQNLICALHGLPPLLLLALVLVCLCPPSLGGLLILAAVFGCRTVVLRATLRRFFGDAGLHQPLTSLGSELLQPLHLLHAGLSRTIRWRHRRYRVRDTDDFTAV